MSNNKRRHRAARAVRFDAFVAIGKLYSWSCWDKSPQHAGAGQRVAAASATQPRGHTCAEWQALAVLAAQAGRLARRLRAAYPFLA